MNHQQYSSDGGRSGKPDEAHSTQPTADNLIELAWGLIANAGGGNWESESREWRQAAMKWREIHSGWLTERTEHSSPHPEQSPSTASMPKTPTPLNTLLTKLVVKAQEEASTNIEDTTMLPETSAAIKSLMLGLIGEDEPNDGFTEDETVVEDLWLAQGRKLRNGLRAELRKKVEDL